MQLLATVRKLTADSEAAEHQIASAAFAKAETEAQRLHEVRPPCLPSPVRVAFGLTTLLVVFYYHRRRNASSRSCKHGGSSRP